MIPKFGPYVYRVVTLTALSSLIASFGLLQNSAAVVIGAMLVSPLMQPIIGLAAAIVSIDSRRQLISIGLITLSALESVALAALVAWIAPTFQAVTITPEILLRTAPGILDLGIACAAGASAPTSPSATVPRPRSRRCDRGRPHATPRRGRHPARRGNGHLAAGAFLLFTTNLFGIVLAAALTLSTRRLLVEHRVERQCRVALLVPIVVAFAIAYPLVRQSSAADRQVTDESLVRSVLVPPLRAQGLGIQTLQHIRN